jgi:menaquinol-cytochrome c reductase iron-sulfur subunit
MQREPEEPRRVFLASVAKAVATFVGVVVGLPALAYLGGPLARAATANWVKAGAVNTFVPGDPKLVAVTISRQDGWRTVSGARTCWVNVTSAGEIVVFNGRCTHLGCAYGWQSQGGNAGRFVCPCHEGMYSIDGTVLAGPPPRPLDELESRIDGDQLMVLYQDFRLGSATREPV